MAELVERYVHLVGHYVPRRERKEIEAELRSQIQDELEDRFGPAPTEADVIAVLAEMGEPRQMAAAYHKDEYLVGPEAYPYMVAVLRYGWVLVPSIVVFLSVFGAITSPAETSVGAVVLDAVGAALQVTFVFTSLVVLFFALLQRVDPKVELPPFDPAGLPEVNDPAVVDRFEAVFGIAFGTIVTLVLLYFAAIGGLTHRFNLSDPGDVIPAPVPWLIAMMALSMGMVAVAAMALRRNRWDAGLWLFETVLEVCGAISLYFAVLEPLVQHAAATNPSLAESTLFASVPEIVTAVIAVATLLGRGTKLVQLWGNRAGAL